MKAIYKYPLPLSQFNDIEIPEGGSVLSVMLQRGVICLWVLVDTSIPPEIRTFEIIGTGNHIAETMGVFRKYIGSVQADTYVWHVFEHILSDSINA